MRALPIIQRQFPTVRVVIVGDNRIDMEEVILQVCLLRGDAEGATGVK